MNTFIVAVVLGCALSLTSAQSCEYPHKGDGGVLDKNGKYIKDSVLVWVDVASNSLPLSNDAKGTKALISWISATNQFNTYMQKGDTDGAFKMLQQANDSFKDVAPYISKPELSAYFKKVNKEFGALVAKKDLKAINQYMIKAYPQFKEKLGCANATSCEFTHKGDGGVLDKNGKYIKDSVLVWVDVASNSLPFSNDAKGTKALMSWISATNQFNTYMQKGDTDGAFKMLQQANDSFKDVAPYISKPELSAYFKKVNKEFGALVAKKDLKAINQYMINAYPQFKEKLGCASAKSCEFPHKGDGGVFDKNGKYIKDSVLVWVDVATNCLPLATDAKGIKALTSWISATNQFNTFMQKGDTDGAFKMLQQANNSFKDVAPYISKPELSAYFEKVNKEFGALVAKKDLKAINQYMINAYPQFKEKLGCASAKSCEFPHKGDGGVFDKNGKYIKDSVLVWVDVATNCLPLATDAKGIKALTSWISATNQFNTFMQKGDTDGAFKMLQQANNSFKDVAPYISKPELSAYFTKVNKEFGALVAKKDLKPINQYMIKAYPQFKEKLGCVRAKSCEFPHKGNGGVFDKNGKYIKDSVLVWVDVATNCLPLVNDANGTKALKSWISATNQFNTFMQKGDTDGAFKMLQQANNSFKAVAPFISKPQLSAYFTKVNKEFGALVAKKDLKPINQYMINAYPQFKEKLGCVK